MKERSTKGEAIAEAQSPNLHHVPVDPRAVGAFQVGQDEIASVLLHLGVKAADPLVIEPQVVAFLTADRERKRKILENPALVHAVQDLNSNRDTGARGDTR